MRIFHFLLKNEKNRGIGKKWGFHHASLFLTLGACATLGGVEAATSRSILAVAGSADQGVSTTFGPNGSFLTDLQKDTVRTNNQSQK